ncbi:hypothetical protein [Azorhizobium doebereinerae]|uniref:hypothetical protein n=1 Tax=Azorhizobium doebereinerae TaxID=281091 RepID=UPI0004007499|nr:hypothetical protein [Azorhizobium doebereinerae]
MLETSYVRSSDGSVMLEYAPGMFVSAYMADLLGLIDPAVVKAAVKRHRSGARLAA